MKSPEISLDKLPASVKLFIEKNYSGYHILTAVPNPLCQAGDAIDLSIEKVGLPKLSLYHQEILFINQEQTCSINLITN